VSFRCAALENSVLSEQDAYNELCCYTLAHTGGRFIHQHVVDAFIAQHANEATKPWL
jgi:hypothetical protein